METLEKRPVKIIFNILDYKEDNIYQYIEFKTLKKDAIKIDQKQKEINLYFDTDNDLCGEYKEKIYLVSQNKDYPKISIIITICFDIDNIYNTEVNKKGDGSFEINKMWDINNGDESKDIKEREINDVIYRGQKIETYEKLYERKRWNFLNVQVDEFDDNLFSERSLTHIRTNGNKTYKYDILLNNNNVYKFLSIKKYEKKVALFDEKEKSILEKKIESLKSEFEPIYSAFEESKSPTEIINNTAEVCSFIKDNQTKFNKLSKDFELYNNKWDLKNFSENDLLLFIKFSDFQIYFKIDALNYRELMLPQYTLLKNQIISNQSLKNLEKASIIFSFSKFCNKILKHEKLPKLVLVEELKESAPFRIAIENYKKIIEGLNENSALFKKLLLFDMGSTEIINHWDFKNSKVKIFNRVGLGIFPFESKYDDFRTELKKFNKNKTNENISKLTFPVLSMLTINQLKEHLNNLLPKFYYKVDTIYDFNAVSDETCKVSFYNINKILSLNVCNEKNNYLDSSCILSLMIEINHEAYSHLKIRYSNSVSASPLLNPLSDGYIFLCTNNYEAESGYYSDYCLTDNYEELLYLKFPNEDLVELTKPKYWIDANFNKMKKFNRNIMIKNKNKKKLKKYFLYLNNNIKKKLLDTFKEIKKIKNQNKQKDEDEEENKINENKENSESDDETNKMDESQENKTEENQDKKEDDFIKEFENLFSYDKIKSKNEKIKCVF